jgi:site-specific DNA-methyltransferase (adenine-specific)
MESLRNKIILGDCRDLMAGMEAGSVDFIGTDPPYPADLYERAYTVLARGAMHVLKPGGFCFTYAPQRHLDEIMDIMRRPGLRYYWIIQQLNLGRSNAMVHDRMAICLHKPILVFVKPLLYEDALPLPPLVFCDTIRGLKQKAFHPWQQSIHDPISFLSRFTLPGDLVFDPYMGTGTIPLAAKLLGRDYLGCEIDPETFRDAQDRMGQAPMDLSTFGYGRRKS